MKQNKEIDRHHLTDAPNVKQITKRLQRNQWRRKNFALGGTGAGRTGSEVHGDKVIQK